MDSLDQCEMCLRRRGIWYLLDENAEVKLCRPCAAELEEAGEQVEAM